MCSLCFHLPVLLVIFSSLKPLDLYHRNTESLWALAEQEMVNSIPFGTVRLDGFKVILGFDSIRSFPVLLKLRPDGNMNIQHTIPVELEKVNIDHLCFFQTKG